MEEFGLFNVLQGLSNEMHTLTLLLMVINFIIHVLFAGAVARDAGELSKLGHGTYLVSGISWAFATLVGGVYIAAIYWFIHHLNFTRR